MFGNVSPGPSLPGFYMGAGADELSEQNGRPALCPAIDWTTVPSAGWNLGEPEMLNSKTVLFPFTGLCHNRPVRRYTCIVDPPPDPGHKSGMLTKIKAVNPRQIEFTICSGDPLFKRIVQNLRSVTTYMDDLTFCRNKYFPLHYKRSSSFALKHMVHCSLGWIVFC